VLDGRAVQDVWICPARGHDAGRLDRVHPGRSPHQRAHRRAAVGLDAHDYLPIPDHELAKSDPALLKRTDSKPVRVMIKLDHDAVASYQGGIGELPATSPSVTGCSLTGSSANERKYGDYVASRENAFVDALRKAVPNAQVGRRLRTVYGGVAASIPANTVKTVLGIDGVVAVQSNKLEKPLTDSSPEFVNAPPVYAELGTTENAGAGVIYGNLDTGIWPEHPSLADLGNLKPPPVRRRSATTARSLRRTTRSSARTSSSAGHTSPTTTTPSLATTCLKARRGTATATARTRRRPRPGTSSRTCRSSARRSRRSTALPPARGSWSTRCAARRAASTPTREPPSGRPSSTGST